MDPKNTVLYQQEIKGSFGTKMNNAWISNAEISNAGFSFIKLFGSLFSIPTCV